MDPNRPTVKLSQHRRYLYGITNEQYDAMEAAQGGVCKICRKRPEGQGGKSDKLHVDHCHATHTVRGLLCWRCNIAIGMFNDDTATIESAIAYLHGWQSAPTNG